MQTQSSYVQVIRDAYPDLAINTVHMHNGAGQNSNILLVNDGLIFRFPRYDQGVAALAIELAILRYIHATVPLPVPNPIYTSSDIHTVGSAFMGYRMLAGEPLWRETVAAISDPATVQGVAGQLGHFLAALHALPVEPLITKVPVRDDLATWRQMYGDIRQQLFRFMRPAAQTQVAHHFETFLNTPRLHQYPVSLRHGDFGTGNILYDAATHTISGIIDWGSAALGDPAVDIAAMSGYRPAFFEAVCAAYGVDEAMLERVRFYRGTYALQEALHGVKHGDGNAFENGIALYI